MGERNLCGGGMLSLLSSVSYRSSVHDVKHVTRHDVTCELSKLTNPMISPQIRYAII